MSMKPFGILGGMGPGAGIYFAEKVIAATPATVDQEHIPFILYNDPSIPDRTKSVTDGNLDRLVGAITNALKTLEDLGVSEIFIPCNTSFVGYAHYEHAVGCQVYHLPHRTLDVIAENDNRGQVLLLATKGSYLAHVYKHHHSIEVLYPDDAQQKVVMSLIYDVVKSARPHAKDDILGLLDPVMSDMRVPVILGCTELSMLANDFRSRWPEVTFIDPLEIAATYVVARYERARGETRSHG